MRDEGPSRAEGPGIDDEGQPGSWWSRLLFQRRVLGETEYRLGMALVGMAILMAMYTWGSVVPQMLGNVAIGVVNVLSWAGGLFSGGGNGAQEVTTVLTPQPTTAPVLSPSPSPSPLASPSPSPLPR
jgi:hypothetical protein